MNAPEHPHTDSPREASDVRPKVAVVIGAIGVRAVAAIPLFEFLDEAGIETDLLIGSSGGAVLAAMRGIGMTPAAMRDAFARHVQGKKLFARYDYRTILGFAHPKLMRPGIGYALKRADESHAFYRRLFGDRRLEDLRPTTLLQATGCLAGESVPLQSGPLADAVYAASAMSPEFPPIKVEGRWLADGAYTSPVPIREAVRRDADVIIALFYLEEAKPQPEDLIESNYNILTAYFRRLMQDQTMLSVDLHANELLLLPVKADEYVGPWDTDALPRLLAAGQQTVDRMKDEIRLAIEGFAQTRS